MKKVTAVDCVPLNLLLHKAHVRHINFFILDVEARSCQAVYYLPLECIDAA